MATKVLKHAVIYTGDEVIEDGYIRFDDKILAVGPMFEYVAQANETVFNMNGQSLVPGFIDVHCHGGYSYDTMDGNAEEINKMATLMMQNEGVTTLFPTTMTQSVENIEKAMQAVNAAAQSNKLIQGIHLEGPFISKVFKGAQPEEYIKYPDIDLMKRWNELSGNRIRLVTYAPENPGAREFENYCLANNIIPSAGHSNATRAEMFCSNATHITHLYNAQRRLQHREPGVTGHALLEDNLRCELIADGFHVAPDMCKLAYEIKGPERIDLITDAMRAKGMPEGQSELGGQKVMVKDKQARLEDGTLAGSVLMYKDAFKNIQTFTGCTMFEAVLMSSVNLAEEFNLTHKGKLEVGRDADINVFDHEMNLTATYSYGEVHQHH